MTSAGAWRTSSASFLWLHRVPDLKPRLSHIPTAWVAQGCNKNRMALRNTGRCRKRAGRCASVTTPTTYEQASAAPCGLPHGRPIGTQGAVDLLVGFILAD